MENIVRVVYRLTNGAIDVFYEVLEDLLEQLSVVENTTFIAGDYNVDLKNKKNIVEMNLLLNGFGYKIVFNEYTRVTPTSASCLDNV